jgi:hypothetical protein
MTLTGEQKDWFQMCNHGIVAIRPDEDGKGGDVVHLTTFYKEPTEDDFINIEKELWTNPKYGFVGEKLVFRKATQEVMDYAKAVTDRLDINMEEKPDGTERD